MIPILVAIFAIFNLVFIVSYMLGQYCIFKPECAPKLSAYYSTYLAVMLSIYFLYIFILCIFGAVNHTYSLFVFLLFIIAPFVIGKFSTYKKIIVYSNLQLLSLFLSLFYSIALLIKYF